MTGKHEANSPEISVEEMRAMREDELLEFISETVQQLNKLGDRLEAYARERIPKKGDEGA